MNIARGVGRARFSSDSRNPHDAFCLLADFVQEAGRGEVRAVVGDLEGSECTTSRKSNAGEIDTTTHPAAFAWTTL